VSKQAVIQRLTFESTKDVYGPFAVSWNKWLSTGVSVKKGDRFTVKSTGAFKSRNQNSDVKFCGPDGCGYWGWFVMKIKIGAWMRDVGSSGFGVAEADGAIEFGAPRGGEMRPDDEGNCTGTVSVELTVDRQ
jgi:hypothetical protein